MTKIGLDIEGRPFPEGREAFEKADVRQKQLLGANTESSGAQYENCRGEGKKMPHSLTRKRGWEEEDPIEGGGGSSPYLLLLLFVELKI